MNKAILCPMLTGLLVYGPIASYLEFRFIPLTYLLYLLMLHLKKRPPPLKSCRSAAFGEDGMHFSLR